MRKRKKITLSICNPVHNEAENIKELVLRIHRVINALFEGEWEHILVNDGSGDNSEDIIKELQKKYDNIVLVNHKKNKGEAAAWTSGFKKAKGKLTVLLAADLQSPPEEIPKLLKIVSKQGYDVGTGRRGNRKDGLFYWSATRILNLFMSLVFGLRGIQDASSSFFAVRTSFVKNLKLMENDHRYILAIFKQRGATIKEVPFKHSPRIKGEAHYTKLKVIKAIPEVFSFTARFYKKKYL